VGAIDIRLLHDGALRFAVAVESQRTLFSRPDGQNVLFPPVPGNIMQGLPPVKQMCD
jgi:hypothetical protein